MYSKVRFFYAIVISLILVAISLTPAWANSLSTTQITFSDTIPHQDISTAPAPQKNQLSQNLEVDLTPATLPLLATDPVTLTLLHNNDGETGLLPTESGGDDVGGIAAFKTVFDRESGEAQGSGNAVVAVYAGDAFLASATLQCSLPIADTSKPIYDAIGQRQIDYTAHILGNHEFDYTPDFLDRFIRAFEDGGQLTQPFLSANLDFSGEPSFDDLVDADGLIDGTPTDGRVLGKSLIYTDTTTGAVFGIVGATTPDLASVSSPRDVTVSPDSIQAVQDEIDRMQTRGVNKIIFVSHLQSVENDREFIRQLRGIDIAVAGGGDNFLVNPLVDQNLQLLPGQDASEIEGEYPLTETDPDNRTVYIVTSIDKYRFLGRLDVQFDAAGEVVQVITEESYPRRVVLDTTSALADAVTPNAGLVTEVNNEVTACLEEFANTVLAETEILFDVSRNGVRGGENNTGNLVADSFIDSYDNYAANTSLDPRSLTNPVVVLQNGGGIRQNAGDVLPRDNTVPGPITQLDTIDVLPFNNFISVVQSVSPAELLEVLDNISTQGIYHVANLKLVYEEVTVDDSTRYFIDTITLINFDDSEQLLVEDGSPVSGAPDITVVTNSFVGGREFADNTNQTFLEDDAGGFILYEQPLSEYLLTFPGPVTPTIPAGDVRYQPDGEGRITIGDPDTIGLRVTHLAPFALDPSETSVADISAQSSEVLVEISNTTDVSTSLKFSETSDYFDLSPTQSQITVTPQVIPALKGTFEITPTFGKNQNLYLIGDNINDYSPINGILINETTATTEEGQGKIRVIHAAPFAESLAGTEVDIDVLDSSSNSVGTPFPSTNVPYGGDTGYVELDAGDYILVITPSSSSTPVIEQPFTLSEGSVENIFVTGNGTNQPLVTTLVPAPSVGGSVQLYLPIVVKN